MNKREQAEVEELRVRLALRFTDGDASPDVPAPTSEFPARTRGHSFNAYAMSIEAMWSEAYRHGSMVTPNSARQQGIPLYSTKLLALRALRRAVELECAKKLRAIDVRIEAEAGEP